MWVAVRRGTLGWKLVGDTLLRSSGRGGRGHRKGHLRHQRVFWALPESVHFAAARTCGRALRGLGVPKFSRGPPREVLGTPRNPRKRIWGSLWDSRGASRVHFRVFGARLSLRRTAWEAKVRSSNSPKCSIGANPAKLCSKFFFRGRRLWPQAISYVQLFEISASSSCEKESLRK